MTRRRGWMWGALAVVPVLAGCVYYNAMWSAERYAKDARNLERSGQESEARFNWSQAAIKAEAVVARHPRSRWADDALVLQAEALARSGACEEAANPIARARGRVKDLSLQERVDLAEAECALAAGRASQAEAALSRPLVSKDGGRRSRAEYLAGQAAASRLDYAAAVDHFQRSREPAAWPGRTRALLASGRTPEAVAVLDSVGGDQLFAADRADVLSRLAAVGGPEIASVTLDRLLTRRISFVEQAQLLIADGDRRLMQDDFDAAQARYQRAVLVAMPASVESGTARVRLQRLGVARATRRSDLEPVIAELTRLSRADGGGGSTAKQLLDQVSQMMETPETPGARFRIAEIARDSLRAPTLAAQLFLEIGAADTGSLFAPKALLAALALLPDRRDSITAVLDTRYGTSPYTRAFHGEPNLAYVAAEDSLARELGVEVAEAAGRAPAAARVDVPIPGPRGPQLDEPVRRRIPAQPRSQPRPVPLRSRSERQ